MDPRMTSSDGCHVLRRRIVCLPPPLRVVIGVIRVGGQAVLQDDGGVEEASAVITPETLKEEGSQGLGGLDLEGGHGGGLIVHEEMDGGPYFVGLCGEQAEVGESFGLHTVEVLVGGEGEWGR